MSELNDLRKDIDKIDKQLVSLLDERFAIVKKVSKYKKDHNLDIIQSDRQKEILDQIVLWAKDPHLKDKLPTIFTNLFKLFVKQEFFFHHEKFPFRRVGIIGLGLMGGSIAKALKLKNADIIIEAYDPSEDANLALIDRVVDRMTSLENLVSTAEFIFVCTPLSEIIPTSQKIAFFAKERKEKLIVIDIGSVKANIMDLYADLTNNIVEFVATHPMAGKETQGYTNSEVFLLANSIWIMILHSSNTDETKKLVEKVIEFLGARPLILKNKQEHDEQTAWISHIPAFLSQSYYKFVSENHPESLKIAGPSFNSFTRLAHDNPSMWKEIHNLNRDKVISGIKEWIETLNETLDDRFQSQ
jgi:prephenate dehydrogenase